MKKIHFFCKTTWLLFGVCHTGCTTETETKAKLIPNFSHAQNQDPGELLPENTFKVHSLGLEFGPHNLHCSGAVS